MRINQTLGIVTNSVFNGAGSGADAQSNGASGVHGVDMDNHRINNGGGCNRTGLQADTLNDQLGCSTTTSGTQVASAAMDYVNDAAASAGDLCLDSWSCGNSSGGAAIEAFRNMTEPLFDPEIHGGPGYCMNRVAGTNISYFNVSCEFELEYATPLYGYCIPFLLFITVTANLLIVIVLSRRSMATPTNSVLMGESSAIKVDILLRP